MENLVPPNPPVKSSHIITSEDLPSTKKTTPLELTLAQSLELEVVKREIATARPDDLRCMCEQLFFQLMIKNNVVKALMKGQPL